MSPKKFNESAIGGPKQTTLHSFFGVTKSTKHLPKKSGVSAAKKPPKTRTFKKKASPKKKITELESDDDEHLPYNIAKSQMESSAKKDKKVLAVNKPTPLKKSYRSNLKVEQIKQKIAGSLMQREGEIVEIMDDYDVEVNGSPKKIKTENGAINVPVVKSEPVQNLSRVTRKLFNNSGNIFEPIVKIEELSSNQTEMPKVVQTKANQKTTDLQTRVKQVSDVDMPQTKDNQEVVMEMTKVGMHQTKENQELVKKTTVLQTKVKQEGNVDMRQTKENQETDIGLRRFFETKENQEGNVDMLQTKANQETDIGLRRFFETKEIQEGNVGMSQTNVNQEVYKKTKGNQDLKKTTVSHTEVNQEVNLDMTVSQTKVKQEVDVDMPQTKVYQELNKETTVLQTIIKQEVNVDMPQIIVNQGVNMEMTVAQTKVKQEVDMLQTKDNPEVTMETTVLQTKIKQEVNVEMPQTKENREVNMEMTVSQTKDEVVNIETPMVSQVRVKKEFSQANINIATPGTSKIKQEPEEVDLDATIINLEEYGIFEDEERDELKMKVDVDTFVDFNEILAYVENQPNLFSVLFEEEHTFLRRFIRLHEKYRFFCFRLFTRQLVWHEVEGFKAKINLDMEDELFREMLGVLEDMKIINTDYTKEEPIDLLNQLNAKEVKAIYQSFKLKKKCKKKDEYIKSVLKHCSSQSTLTFAKSSDDLLVDRIREKMGSRVKLDLNFYNMLARVHLLYSFMNPDFIRPADLYKFKGEVRKGICVLPTFSTDFTQVFTREKFLRYFLAVEQYNEFMIAKEQNSEKKMLRIAKLAFEDFKQIVKEAYNDEQTTMHNFHKRFTAGRVLAKILSMACKQFTRESDLVMEWLEFLVRQNQYALRMRGEWYNHIAMIHEKRKEFEWAIDKLYEAFVDPDVSDISKFDLSHRANRLLPKCDDKDTKAVLSELILPPPEEIQFPSVLIVGKKVDVVSMRVYFDLHGSSVTVEDYALNHYSQHGYPKGIHTEGRLMTTMYILLFWDIIFDKYVPGTFISEIQYVPLDFFSADFYLNRKTEIDWRLNNIENGWTHEELERRLMESHLRYGNVFTVAGTMDNLHADILMDAVRCVERRVLRMVFERFVRNYRDHRAGMPDLFVCNPNTLKCKFVEVKSENDILSMKQMVWLDYLRSNGADIEVCHVYSEGKKIKRKLLK